MNACICHAIVSVDNQLEVLILQHPAETGNAKGSVRLLDLCLDKSRVVQGESFDAQMLSALLYQPVSRGDCNDAGERMYPVLMYPDTASSEAADLQIRLAPRFDVAEAYSHVRLVILDATWRKSRKMLYLNPVLQSLPRLSLDAMPASHYRIRKAHKPDQLSSLEACTYALMRLENDEEKFLPLLQAFDCFVEQQLQRMPFHSVSLK